MNGPSISALFEVYIGLENDPSPHHLTSRGHEMTYVPPKTNRNFKVVWIIRMSHLANLVFPQFKLGAGSLPNWIVGFTNCLFRGALWQKITNLNVIGEAVQERVQPIVSGTEHLSKMSMICSRAKVTSNYTFIIADINTIMANSIDVHIESNASSVHDHTKFNMSSYHIQCPGSIQAHCEFYDRSISSSFCPPPPSLLVCFLHLLASVLRHWSKVLLWELYFEISIEYVCCCWCHGSIQAHCDFYDRSRSSSFWSPPPSLLSCFLHLLPSVLPHWSEV